MLLNHYWFWLSNKNNNQKKTQNSIVALLCKRQLLLAYQGQLCWECTTQGGHCVLIFLACLKVVWYIFAGDQLLGLQVISNSKPYSGLRKTGQTTVLLDGQQKFFDLLCEYHFDALSWQLSQDGMMIPCSRNSNRLVFVGLFMMPSGREPDHLTSVFFNYAVGNLMFFYLFILLLMPFSQKSRASIHLLMLSGWNNFALEALIVCDGGEACCY